jgi:hypothetical protein
MQESSPPSFRKFVYSSSTSSYLPPTNGKYRSPTARAPSPIGNTLPPSPPPYDSDDDSECPDFGLSSPPDFDPDAYSREHDDEGFPDAWCARSAGDEGDDALPDSGPWIPDSMKRPLSRDPMDEFTWRRLKTGTVKQLPVIFEDYFEHHETVDAPPRNVITHHADTETKVFKSYLQRKETPLQGFIRRKKETWSRVVSFPSMALYAGIVLIRVSQQLEDDATIFEDSRSIADDIVCDWITHSTPPKAELQAFRHGLEMGSPPGSIEETTPSPAAGSRPRASMKSAISKASSIAGIDNEEEFDLFTDISPEDSPPSGDMPPAVDCLPGALTVADETPVSMVRRRQSDASLSSSFDRHPDRNFSAMPTLHRTSGNRMTMLASLSLMCLTDESGPLTRTIDPVAVYNSARKPIFNVPEDESAFEPRRRRSNAISSVFQPDPEAFSKLSCDDSKAVSMPNSPSAVSSPSAEFYSPKNIGDGSITTISRARDGRAPSPEDVARSSTPDRPEAVPMNPIIETPKREVLALSPQAFQTRVAEYHKRAAELRQFREDLEKYDAERALKPVSRLPTSRSSGRIPGVPERPRVSSARSFGGLSRMPQEELQEMMKKRQEKKEARASMSDDEKSKENRMTGLRWRNRASSFGNVENDTKHGSNQYLYDVPSAEDETAFI